MPESIQQPQQTNDQINRLSDNELIHYPILIDIKTEVQIIRAELIEFKRDVSRAFPKDEDGLPDYLGHRRGHERDNKTDIKKEEFNENFVKDLVKWGGISIIGFIVGLVVTYLRGGPAT